MCEKRVGKGVWREGEEGRKEGKEEGERGRGRKKERGGEKRRKGGRRERKRKGGRGKERGRREESKGVVSKEGEMKEWERSGPCATGIQREEWREKRFFNTQDYNIDSSVFIASYVCRKHNPEYFIHRSHFRNRLISMICIFLRATFLFHFYVLLFAVS